MNRRVDDEAGFVDAVLGGIDAIAVEIDLDQVGGRHLVIIEAIGIDQKMMVRTRHPGGQMAVDQFGPAEIINQVIGGGEIDPDPPLAIGPGGGMGVGGVTALRRGHGGPHRIS